MGNPDAKTSLIEKLLHYHPSAISIPDTHGRLPIHLACDSGKPSSFLSILYTSYQQSLYIQDIHGYTPLHYTCQSIHSTPDAITTLLSFDTHKTIANIKDIHNRLPLHHACMSGKSLYKVILPLLHYNPDGIYHVDVNHSLPFHLYALYNANNNSSMVHDNDLCLEEKENSLVKHTFDVDRIDALFQLLLFCPSCFY